VSSLVKRFSILYVIRKFTTVFTTFRHSCLSWARWVQYKLWHIYFWDSLQYPYYRAGSLGGKVLDSYSGGARLESWSGHITLFSRYMPGLYLDWPRPLPSKSFSDSFICHPTIRHYARHEHLRLGPLGCLSSSVFMTTILYEILISLTLGTCPVSFIFLD
jgi:hypothetical protein